MFGILSNRVYRTLFLAQIAALLALGGSRSRSAHPEDRPALFAAQFALSQACWLIAYPLAGLAGARFGLPTTAIALTGLAALGVLTALVAWPAEDPETIAHEHPELRIHPA